MIQFLDLKAAYQELQQPIDTAVRSSLEEAYYILGPAVDQFEQEFAHYTNCEHCVSVGSGLDALVLALRVAGIAAGDEVLVPSHTFIATWLAVTQIGAVPIPVDPEVGRFNLTTLALKDSVTENTKAIISVSLYGQASVDLSMREFADLHQLVLIEDAAQAHGAAIDHYKAGSLADLATWSFYPAKNLGALDDGGAITTNHACFAESLRLLRNYGSSEKYHHQMAGYNSRLGTMQCAVLSQKLKRLDEWNSRRRTIAEMYLEKIKHPDITLPWTTEEYFSVWHLFVIQHPSRDALQQYLLDNGVQTQVHYPIAPHQQVCYHHLGITDEQLPHASLLARTVLSLPIGPHLSKDDAARVVNLVNAFPTA